MTAVERPIGEDELHAYVDGFLGPERRLTVERYLADHPDASARIAGGISGTGASPCMSARRYSPVPPTRIGGRPALSDASISAIAKSRQRAAEPRSAASRKP